MKKVILSLMALCAITAAFAQNSAALSQDGTGNSSITNQTGDAQKAIVSQSGTGNANYNEQNSIYSNDVYVNQVGTSNSAATYQNDYTGPVLVDVYQQGESNSVYINQSNVYTFQTAAYVTQYGMGNRAYVYQYGAYNSLAEIYQNGNNGYAFIYQGNGDAFSSEYNYAYIDQQSIYGPNHAFVGQIGYNNYAYIYQKADAGPYNYAYIYQRGDNNQALVDQSDFYTASTTGYISQMGNGNLAALYQYGGGTGALGDNSATAIDQTGDSNYAILQQSGGESNFADLVQTGDGNVIQGISTAYAIQIGDSNSLFIGQDGNAGTGQLAQVQQFGSGNTGTITQSN